MKAYVFYNSKAATGRCFVKKECPEMCFCLVVCGVLWIVQAQLFCWERRDNSKISVFVQISLFVWDIEVFWILIERTISEHHCKIKYSGKDLPIFLGYWGIYTLHGICFMEKWWHSFLSLMNWKKGIQNAW